MSAWTIVLALTGTVVATIYWFFRRQYKYWADRNIPHLKPTFFFGNTKELGKVNFGVLFRNMYDKMKTERFFGFWQYQRPCLMINDPDLIKDILVGEFSSFADHGIYYNEETDPLSANLFSLEGSAWRNLRVKLTPTFTTGKMKMMFPIMLECTDELLEVLEESWKKKGGVEEVKELVARYSTDVISSCAFGIKTNSLKNPEAEFRVMGRKIFEPTLDVLLRNVMAFILPDLVKILRIRLVPKKISEFFIKVIKETMEYREKNNVKRNDFLQLLMELRKKGYIEDVDSVRSHEDEEIKREEFTFNQALAQAFIFFSAGFETSSSVVQFTLYELALNQEMQDKLRQDIMDMLDKNNGKFTYEGIHELEYLGRILDETLRKYPPAPILNRICTKEYRIPGSKCVIEKGTSVVIGTYGLHMDETYFPNPEKFDPDRFLEDEKMKRHKYVYLPFGEGPRICIGQRFAVMQMRTFVAAALSKYKVEVAKGETPTHVDFDPKGLTFMPKGGMYLKFSKLN